MRIIAGKWRGLRLQGPGRASASLQLRPTPDRLRERLFNMLQSGRWHHAVEEAQILDLFAGTGAVGLEALSRGAAHCVFVENARQALAILHANVEQTKAGSAATIMRQDATRLRPAPHQVDIVFLDPPFRRNLGAKALVSAAQQNWLAPDALVLWEEAAAQDAPPGFELVENLPHGESHLTVLRFAN